MEDQVLDLTPKFILVPGGKNYVIAKPTVPGGRDVFIGCWDEERVIQLTQLYINLCKAEEEANKH
jgi:hypothetical protein